LNGLLLLLGSKIVACSSGLMTLGDKVDQGLVMQWSIAGSGKNIQEILKTLQNVAGAHSWSCFLDKGHGGWPLIDAEPTLGLSGL
jgi:hypothetical protein